MSLGKLEIPGSIRDPLMRSATDQIDISSAQLQTSNYKDQQGYDRAVQEFLEARRPKLMDIANVSARKRDWDFEEFSVAEKLLNDSRSEGLDQDSQYYLSLTAVITALGLGARSLEETVQQAKTAASPTNRGIDPEAVARAVDLFDQAVTRQTKCHEIFLSLREATDTRAFLGRERLESAYLKEVRDSLQAAKDKLLSAMGQEGRYIAERRYQGDLERPGKSAREIVPERPQTADLADDGVRLQAVDRVRQKLNEAIKRSELLLSPR